MCELYWAVLDCSGLYCALMGSSGLSWAANWRDRGEGVTSVTRVIWVTGEATEEGQRRKERKSK